MDHSRFITAAEIAAELLIHEKTIRRRALRGTFPAPVIRTVNTLLWVREDIAHLLTAPEPTK
jgi:predicted DNA-binding transcriptional regulator AlpA